MKKIDFFLLTWLNLLYYYCRLIVFGAGNHEPDFIGCITYCLLQLTADMRIALEMGSGNSAPRTTWHVNPGQDIEARDEYLNSHQGNY